MEIRERCASLLLPTLVVLCAHLCALKAAYVGLGRYALRRAVLSLQGDRAARARRHGERGLGNASARLLLR